MQTPHGAVETPAFMPVGTQGAVKTVGPDDLEALEYQLVLANTYHLALRPGASLVGRMGGLHEFMGWKGAILTDSGGYQVMSLADIRKVDEDGVTFKSHLDGSVMSLTPERALAIQRELGVDIAMALDQCPPYPCPREAATEAMTRTHRWAARTLASREGPAPAVFGIVQGGVHEDLRTKSAEAVGAMPFDGFAIGGVSVGEPAEMQYPVVSHTAARLPASKPRYLMGVGHPKDILHAVASGVDLFDCVLPTRMARHHCVYTLAGRQNASAARWAEEKGPWDQGSVFPATARYSAGYLRHLFRAGEPFAARIATLHNLAFYARLMREIRQAIEDGSWPALVGRYASA